MTKINLEELIADREAGTGGPWKSFGPCKNWNGVYNLFEIHWSDDGECVAETVHGEHDARRIARLPDLEGAYLEAVDILRDLADFKGGMWVLQDRAKDFFRS